MGPNDVADAYVVSILAGADAKYVRLFRLYLLPIRANALVISRMPALMRVSTRKPNIAGAMRITPEGTLGTWYVKLDSILYTNAEIIFDLSLLQAGRQPIPMHARLQLSRP